MNKNQMTSDNDQGSFLTGFGLGLFAGAAGYFLFATDKGKKIQTELTKEWHQAKKNIKTNQTVKDSGATLKEILIETASSFLDLDHHKQTASDKSSAKPTKRKKASKSSSANPKKFTGV